MLPFPASKRNSMWPYPLLPALAAAIVLIVVACYASWNRRRIDNYSVLAQMARSESETSPLVLRETTYSIPNPHPDFAIKYPSTRPSPEVHHPIIIEYHRLNETGLEIIVDTSGPQPRVTINELPPKVSPRLPEPMSVTRPVTTTAPSAKCRVIRSNQKSDPDVWIGLFYFCII